MASIRRALSPANPDRSHQNGGVGFSSFVPESKQSQSQASLALPTFSHSRFLASVVVQRRRGLHGWWQQLFFRLTLLFFLGFLLGMVATFGDSQNGRNRNSDPPFEIEAQPLRINKETVDFEMNAERLSIPVMETIDYALRKQLIVVTPTYNRAVQAFYLNRLGQLLRLVPPPLLWIVVETKVASPETSEILRSTGVIYRHLVCNRSSSTFKDRGIHQRNTALEHIEHHRLNGIVYFADDDNVYSIELFESMRLISRFGTWPVAMVAEGKNKAILEGPVCNATHVIGWHTNERSRRLRRFHVDMSGFAFNSTILWDADTWPRPTRTPIRQLETVKEGFQETTFIEQVVEDESQMEAVPAGCSRILNWHLHFEAHYLPYPSRWSLLKNLAPLLPFRS